MAAPSPPVEAPFGTDQVMLYGFERSPVLLKRLLEQSLAAGSPLLEDLERLLAQEEGKYARSSFQLISVLRQASGL